MTTFDRLLFTFLVIISIPAVLLALGLIVLLVLAAPVFTTSIIVLAVAIYYSTFYLEKKGLRF